jgi:mannose-6-phosphate isomerase-like protein (cupin superfamily)
MKIVKVSAALKQLEKLNQEIRFTPCFEAEQFSTGFIAFRPQKNADPRQISHHDKDVICHVLKGRGRLRINGRRTALRSGTLCHIPRGTPHDFAASGRKPLILFYSLITTGRVNQSHPKKKHA